MSIELTYLVWSAALAFAYLGTQTILFRRQVGLAKANGKRDNDPPPDKWTGRGERALRNFLETYAIFVALAVAVELSGRSDFLTVWGAGLWFWARVAYLPLYMFGITPWRSHVWVLSALGLVMMFAGVVA